MTKLLREAIFDKIFSTFVKGSDKKTLKFLQKKSEEDPELKASIIKAAKLSRELDKSNDEVLAALAEKWKGTPYEKYFELQ